MASRLFYSAVRIIALSLAAAIGYVAVYVPLMNLFFRKEPVGFLAILALSITAAFKCAQLADKLLPRRAASNSAEESSG
ncbi:hypothetical protein [Lacipirellula sp.]|uniref:hypothetical protein n=1 Tax=Lacipirellula sp. TaxID=2691419 RepID=UPI003D13E16F